MAPWQIAGRSEVEAVHGTQKPGECMRWPMLVNSASGDAIYEPSCGSGSTFIAAQMSGRACCGVELLPAYVDVAVGRWQAFTGGVAILEATGAVLARRP